MKENHMAGKKKVENEKERFRKEQDSDIKMQLK